MASLKKRGASYSIVFTRRVEDELEQRVIGLGVKRRDKAERLRVRFEDQYQLGEIDPFNGWSPREKRIQKATPSDNLLVVDGVKFFLASRSHVRPRTMEDYVEQSRRLSEQIGISMPLRLVAEEDIRRYAFQPHLSTASQTTYLRFCRMLFKWLKEAGLIETDVAARIRYPKKDVRVSEKIIDENQLLQVFSAQRSAEREQGGALLHPWFRPMMAMFFYAGLRASEGTRLRWENVSFEKGYLSLSSTKTGRERVVPIRRPLMVHLRAWHRYSGSPVSGPVFFKTHWDGERLSLSPKHISKTFKHYARKAGLPEFVNLHGLRHSCATELLRAGLDINLVAKFLGHSSLEVTRIYEHLTERDLAERILALDI